MVAEIRGEEYEPWFTPVMETLIQGELPGEVESLLFCVQTGIGVGIMAFVMGRFVERKKWMTKAENSSIYSYQSRETALDVVSRLFFCGGRKQEM